jgi:hypothetical protein
MFIAATAAAALSVPLAGLAWAEPPQQPDTNGIGKGGMPDKLGNFVESGIVGPPTGLSAPLPPGKAINLAKDLSPGVPTPTAIQNFEATLWSNHTLPDGIPIPSDPDDWGNITPGLAIKPLTPGCGRGNTGLPVGAPDCVG